jgi:hypothetical protein
VKPPSPPKEKPKKVFITPEEKAKQNLANTLFGGASTKQRTMKGPTSQKTVQPAKTNSKVIETTDLI